MDILVSSLILASVALLWIYLLYSNNGKTSSIPNVTKGSYPVVGHLFSFFANRTKFVMDCRQQYGECFKVKLFTQRTIFVLSPSDWAIILRNQSFHSTVREVGAKIFDITHSISSLPELEPEAHRQYTQYLKNRDGLRPMMFAFVRRMRELMKREKMTLETSTIKSEWIPTGLLQLSHRLVFEPSCRAFFGEIDSHSFESDFRLFDSKFHYFLADFPRWIYRLFFPRELEARTRLNNAWLKNRHPLHESDFIQARQELFLDRPDWFSEKDYTGSLTGLLWASLGNTIPAVFWCLFYVLRDPKAVKAITQEINEHLPAFLLDDDGSDSIIEDWTPDRLALCVNLDSAVNETLRLSTAPMMSRKCNQETEIVLHDGRTLNIKPNELIILFPAIAHFDANIFPNPNEFIFDRFIQKNGDTIPGLMPFGGGKTMCPGRFFARFEIKICVAMLLCYMEYKFIDPEMIPIQESHRIGVGVAPPKEDIPILYRYKI